MKDYVDVSFFALHPNSKYRTEIYTSDENASYPKQLKIAKAYIAYKREGRYEVQADSGDAHCHRGGSESR